MAQGTNAGHTVGKLADSRGHIFPPNRTRMLPVDAVLQAKHNTSLNVANALLEVAPGSVLAIGHVAALLTHGSLSM
eukprot:CAMPEP_0206585790 /NCGR_PEP_ID=MMETSP0325_2-20121206/36628_1 /ASSEMBLY_ACC=CAM_ASM_000347 /TAXON_ID=2866 /ORGANISM="Crypthecodinium cohnii, Strain Seligo" /LENGTH=75 /DNA_ID=CAMNT_0054093407 /DNA_START=893 /DNA_END=1121 /DNA_ORIENTATION=-